MREHADLTPARTRSRVSQEPSAPAAPAFEALEPRLLLSSSDLLMFGAGLAGDAWQGDIVAMSSAEPGGGPLAVHASLADDGGDGAGGAGSVVIDGVPAYVWRHGCGPTAVGMIVGYWDSHGYSNFVEGSAATQTAAVNAMIASAEHYEDYSSPIDNARTGLLADKSSTGGAHDNNSVADWMYTSFSSRQNYYGWSWFSNIDDAFEGYAASVGYSEADARNRTWGVFTWEAYVAEINNDRPVGLIVDTNGDGWTDHFITGIGYDESTHQYAAYNTWDRAVHWYDFAQISTGQRWGVYGGTFFDAGPSTVDAVAPAAELAAASITTRGATTHTFTVTYSDNVAVDVSDIDGSDVRVTGPNGFSQYATLVGVDVDSDGTPRTATYRITAPGDGWDIADNGTYAVTLGAGQVSDTSGNFVEAGGLGAFSVNVAQPEPEPEPDPQETTQKFGSFDGLTRVRLTLPGANGVTVTYSLKGSGYGQIEGDAGSEQIVLYGTNSKTSLIITSELSGAAVGDIVVNGSIGTLSLRGINLVGDITITGTVAQILLNDVFGPSTITIGRPNSYRDSVSFRMHNVNELSINSGTMIRSISVANWADADGLADNITAPSLGRLLVRADKNAVNSGAFESDLTLTGGGVKPTLGGVRIGTSLSDAVWFITGDVGVISVRGAVENWTLTVSSDVGSLRLGTVVSAALEVSGNIGRIMATRWLDGSISASTVGSLSARGDRRAGIRGDFGADLTLTGGGLGPTLGSARIAGKIIGADWNIGGDVGRMQVGWWGAASTLTVAQSGSQGAYPAAATGGGAIGSLRLGGYDDQNDGVAFGVTAASFGRGVRVGRAKLAASDLPFVDGDFRMTSP